MLQSSSCQQARCPTQAQEAEVEVEEKANSQHWRSGAIECCRGKERMPFMSYACICLHEDWYSKIKELFDVLWICFAFKKNLQTEKAKNEEMQKRVRGNTLAYGVEIQVYVHQGHTYAYSMLYITGMMHTCGIPKHSYYCVCVCVFKQMCLIPSYWTSLDDWVQEPPFMNWFWCTHFLRKHHCRIFQLLYSTVYVQ